MEKLESRLQALFQLSEDQQHNEFMNYHKTLSEIYGKSEFQAYWMEYQLKIISPDYNLPIFLRRQAF